MIVSQFVTTTSAAVALALPFVSTVESGNRAALRQSVLLTESGLTLTANENTPGVKLDTFYATGSNTFLVAGISADSEVAANMPLEVAQGYQHDLSNRSSGLLELSSVDPDIAGLDASIEGGVLKRHDW